MPTDQRFGSRRIYYNNFAEHLLNAYNPNMTYPDLPHRWSDADWKACIDMVAAFGFTVFEFWLVPRLFSRQALESPFGREFARQMTAAAEHAHARGLKTEFIAGLATVGDDWRTACPGVPEEWDEIRFLWDQWTRRLPGTDIVGLFPGDPGGCSRNGCTAITYIDRCCDIANMVKRNLPGASFELCTWGPPFYAWGTIQGPPDWKGEFLVEYQRTAWDFNKQRADESMSHLIRRLPDYPADTAVSINLGFNGDGIPAGEQDARPWARAVAKAATILTWDFSLTEGENAIFPHCRFDRLFAQRRREREAAPYAGGICFTMTPRLNQLSLYGAARSFQDPDAEPSAVVAEFFTRALGPGGADVGRLLPLFEVVPDWGNHAKVEASREEFHGRMAELVDCLESLRGRLSPSLPIIPSPDAYHAELLFFARFFADASGCAPDYDALRASYWRRVYAIYDGLPEHVDPRPRMATDNLIRFFRDWKVRAPVPTGPAPGAWITGPAGGDA
jgi:hypothetical protein